MTKTEKNCPKNCMANRWSQIKILIVGGSKLGQVWLEEKSCPSWRSPSALGYLVDSALPLSICHFQRRKIFFRKTMRREAPLSEFKRKDGMISLEHCQEWNFLCYNTSLAF